MKAFVEEGCISCGLCVGTCPDVFGFGDDGFAHVIADVTAENEDEVKQAAENCPVEVIKYEE